MPDRSFLDWPFLDDRHRDLADEAHAAAVALGATAYDEEDVDGACRTLVAQLGASGLLRHVVPAAYGGERDVLDVRSLCLIRETLARHGGLADFAFAMQGLGSAPVTLYGTDAQRA